MGCEVVSVYADQIIGKVSYSDQIIQDLVQRDYHKQSKLVSYEKFANQIKFIYGFTQSFCQSFLFTTTIHAKQYFVYNAGRFVIKSQIKNVIQDTLITQNLKNQQIICFQDIICAMDLVEKLLAVGVGGGSLQIWDLQFMQIKVKINLPQQSFSFSSLSLSNKYVFCTDNSQPNNFVYVFDLKTTKLKASGLFNSLQPILRGISFLQNYHVTIGADGVWFARYSLSNNIVDITKGMFGQFPKTSMAALDKISDKYVISGAVDGYVFIWNKQCMCVKVVKCAQEQISCMKYFKNKLLVCGMNNKVKCFSFSVKEKYKDKNNQQKYQDVQYTVTDSYSSQAPIQRIVVYQQQPLIYFTMSRAGSLKSSVFPSNQPIYQKVKYIVNKQFIRYSRKGQCFLVKEKGLSQSQSKLSLVYVFPKSKQSFQYTKVLWNKKINYFQIQKTELIQTQGRQQDKFYTFLFKYLSLAYLSHKQIYVSRIQVDFEGIQKDSFKIFDIQEQNILGLNYFELQNQIWFILTTKQHVHVFQVKSQNQYCLIKSKQYQGKINFTMKVKQNIELYYDTIRNIWQRQQKLNELNQLKEIEQTHCALLKVYNKQAKISIGGHSIIVWKDTLVEFNK